MDNTKEILNINIEIYKTYVDMADRFSARRVQIPITYFTIISGIVIVMYYVSEMPNLFKKDTLLFFLCVVAILLCGCWLISIWDYRNLGEIKYDVIRDMEEKILTSRLRPYSDEITKDRLLMKDKLLMKKISSRNKLKKLSVHEWILPVLISIPFFCYLFLL